MIESKGAKELNDDKEFKSLIIFQYNTKCMLGFAVMLRTRVNHHNFYKKNYMCMFGFIVGVKIDSRGVELILTCLIALKSN